MTEGSPEGAGPPGAVLLAGEEKDLLRSVVCLRVPIAGTSWTSHYEPPLSFTTVSRRTEGNLVRRLIDAGQKRDPPDLAVDRRDGGRERCRSDRN